MKEEALDRVNPEGEPSISKDIGTLFNKAVL